MVSQRSPIHPTPASGVTRQEVRLTVQMHVMTIYRRCFLRQELDTIHEKMELNGVRGRRPPVSGIDYDRDEIRKKLNTQLRLHRSLIRRQAQYIDCVLYQSANTLEEYYNLDDLGDRMYQVLENLDYQIPVWP